MGSTYGGFGIVIVVASAITWFAADFLAGQSYSQAPVIRYWNAAIPLGLFVVVTLLFPALKELEHEKEAARIDDLTGAANRRFFFEVAQRELDRSQRYKRPFAIAYIDLDGFKAVNDQLAIESGTGFSVDSAENPPVHPSSASEPILSFSKERTEGHLKLLGSFPFMLSPVEAFLGFFSRISVL